MIELDLSQPWDADDPLAFGPRPPSRGRRWRVPALLAATIAALLGGAVAPPRHDPVLAQSAAQAGLVFGRDDTVFLYQQRARSGRLQAYLPDRQAPLWTADYPNGNPMPTVTTDPAFVLVSIYPADPSRPGENRLEVRESRTGRALWQRTGVGIVDVSGGVLIVTDYRGWGGTDDISRPGTVEALDIGTGTTRWSHAIDQTTLLAVESARPPGPNGDTRADATALAELDQEGRLRILDPASGAERHTVRLALPGPALYFTVQDGAAAVTSGQPGDNPASPERGPATVVGYDLQTGEVRWRDDGPDFVVPCGGRYMCEYGQEALTVTDPGTGDVRYRGEGSAVIRFRGDRLLVAQEDLSTELWDLTTGRRLRVFKPWRLVAPREYDGDLVTTTDARNVLTIARLDARTGTVQVLGRAGNWYGEPDCTVGQRYLGCAGPGGVRIWRLPDKR